MVSIILFVLVAGIPFIIYLVNSGLAAKENRGIAAGIPKPKQPKEAKAPRPGRTARTAKVRSRRVEYCGRGFTHFALALMGSQDSCKHCRYLQEVPPAAGIFESEDDNDALSEILNTPPSTRPD